MIAVGRIATLDDAMDFLVAGASAVQVGTANFYDPTASMRIVEGLPEALASLGASKIVDVGGAWTGEQTRLHQIFIHRAVRHQHHPKPPQGSQVRALRPRPRSTRAPGRLPGWTILPGGAYG